MRRTAFLSLLAALSVSVTEVLAAPNPQVTPPPLGPLKKGPVNCEAAGSSYGSDAAAKSSLTFDCAHYIGSYLLTQTVLSTPVHVVEAVSTVTETPDPDTLITQRLTTPTTKFGTTTIATHFTTAYGLYETFTEITIGPWTTSIYQSSPPESTSTVLIISAATTVTPPGAAFTTTTVNPVFDDRVPQPPRFKAAIDCSPEKQSAYCSSILNAPVPTPFTTRTLEYHLSKTRTTYTATVTTTAPKVKESTTTEWHTTTFTHPTFTSTTTITTKYPTHTFQVYDFNPEVMVTKIVTMLPARLTIITKTTTPETYTASTVTISVTPTVSIPQICKQPPNPAAHSLYGIQWYASKFSGLAGAVKWYSRIATREQCCALCFTSTEGCVFYEYDAVYPNQACNLIFATDTPEYGGPGYITDTCPIGQLAGDWREKPARDSFSPMNDIIHTGPCWNGFREGLQHVPQTGTAYNHCYEEDPIGGISCYYNFPACVDLDLQPNSNVRRPNGVECYRGQY